MANRTLLGSGCPQCGREASCNQTRQPSITNGASRLLAEWDWDANETHGWHPNKVTLGLNKKVDWVLQLQAGPGVQVAGNTKQSLCKKIWLPLSNWQECVCLRLPGCAVP